MTTPDPAAPDNTGLPPLYAVAQVRAVEAAAMAGLPRHALMQRAALAAAGLSMRILGGRQASPRVLVAAGTGNNGGDALECAALLAGQGCAVTVLIPVLPAPARLPAADESDYTNALAQVEALAGHIEIVRGTDRLDELAGQPWDLVVDGLFGIGLSRPLAHPWRAVVAMLNASTAPVLALDVPSGLNADTGAVAVDPPARAGIDTEADAIDGTCVRASHTITFIADKPGLHTGSGREMAGDITLAGLDIDPAVFPAPLAWRNGPAAFPEILSLRRHDSHKGSYGDVHIVGGATGMAGAAILAAQAALKSGCGRVLIGFALEQDVPQFIPGQPELMCRAASTLFGLGSAAPATSPAASNATRVVGPGLGTDALAVTLVEAACDSGAPLVLDADALNLVAMSASLQSRLAARSGATILTPHPLEAARLLGVPVSIVQSDRLAAAHALARRFHAIVVLKGSGTIIVEADHALINPTGNPALATGGTGDVLAGMCGALLAQGWRPLAAAAGAVWLHGAAADSLVTEGVGPVGVTAGEIIDAARRVRNQITSDGPYRNIILPGPAAPR